MAEDPLPRAKPEEVGFSGERLARIDSVLKADIDAGRIPGAVIAIARHGKLVKLDAYGFRDKAAGVAMTTDTIFNIASMPVRPGEITYTCTGTWLTHQNRLDSSNEGASHAVARGVCHGPAT